MLNIQAGGEKYCYSNTNGLLESGMLITEESQYGTHGACHLQKNPDYFCHSGTYMNDNKDDCVFPGKPARSPANGNHPSYCQGHL